MTAEEKENLALAGEPASRQLEMGGIPSAEFNPTAVEGQVELTDTGAARIEDYREVAKARVPLVATGLYPRLEDYAPLSQKWLDWLAKCGVSVKAIRHPEPLRLARGNSVAGRFIYIPDGSLWVVYAEAEDVIFWRPKTGELATYSGRAFALGEEAIEMANSMGALRIFSDPLRWLQAERAGICIVAWQHAFDRLRHVPYIEIDASLEQRYLAAMRPPVPRLQVIREGA